MSRFKALTLGLVEEGRFEAEIDVAIDNVLESRKPAHYLAYGG